MNPSSSKWTDERLEHFLGHLLRLGVLLSAAVVLLGGVAYLKEFGKEEPQEKVFHREPPELRQPWSIVQGAAQFQSRALIQLGLLLLIATPVARVLFSAIGFFLQRDRLYVVFTLLVLTILIYSLVGRHP